MAFGIAFVIAGSVILAFFADSRGVTILFGFILVMALGWLLNPLRLALSVKRVIARGERGTAEVVELEDIHDVRVTVDALRNGWAQGTRVVTVGPKTFRERFATDAPWAHEIQIGSKIEVVVAPGQDRAVLDLGLS